jgi:hypothetical protein
MRKALRKASRSRWIVAVLAALPFIVGFGKTWS